MTAFDNGGDHHRCGFSISQIQESVPSFGTIKLDSASGGFIQYTGFQLGAFVAQSASTVTSAPVASRRARFKAAVSW
ncbi:MAG: hypothetical protein WDO73_02400 [Ignavibacteriota bacterium]